MAHMCFFFNLTCLKTNKTVKVGVDFKVSSMNTTFLLAYQTSHSQVNYRGNIPGRRNIVDLWNGKLEKYIC